MTAVSVAELRTFVLARLKTAGLNDANAGDTAEALVQTDAMGVFTHGTKLLSGYLKKLAGGGYRAAAVPTVEREGPGWAVVDGGSCLGQVGAAFAVRLATAKARATGIAYVGIKNIGHVGAAGHFAATAARQGFIAQVTGNDIPSVAAPGSRRAVLGSNPIALAIPVTGSDPILLDVATAAVAGGKVYAARQRGEPIPDTWLIGPDGRPTADAGLYPEQAALAPMAGHKGYGLGLWIEVLSAVLPGGHVTWQVGSWIFDEPSRPSWHNAAVLLFDVGAMDARDSFDARLQALIAEIHAAPTVDGVERVLLPGEREWANVRRAATDGIPLPADVREKLRSLVGPDEPMPRWLSA